MKMWLVGAGYWGSKLLGSLEKFGVDVTVIDIKNGQTINDIDTLDPVMLATPLWQHYDQARQLLKKGHNLYIEKPMAETTEQIKELCQLAQPDQIVMVGHLFAHHPQMAQIKNIIKSNKIGSVVHVTSRRLNWGIYQTKTDPLLSLAVHDISIVQCIVKQTLHVDSAQAWNYSRNCQFDRIRFNGQTNTAVTFDIDVSWHWPNRVRETIVIGTHGQITWDQDANTITVTNHIIENNRAVTNSDTKVIKYDYKMSPLEYELAHWVDCIADRRQPTTGFAEAQTVAEAVDQVKSLLTFSVLGNKPVS